MFFKYLYFIKQKFNEMMLLFLSSSDLIESVEDTLVLNLIKEKRSILLLLVDTVRTQKSVFTHKQISDVKFLFFLSTLLSNYMQYFRKKKNFISLFNSMHLSTALDNKKPRLSAVFGVLGRFNHFEAAGQGSQSYTKRDLLINVIFRFLDLIVLGFIFKFSKENESESIQISFVSKKKQTVTDSIVYEFNC